MRRATGAVVCPNCERLVSAQEARCPYCGAWQPGMFGFGPALRKMFGGQLDLGNIITVACGALYVLSLALDPAAIFHAGGMFDFLSPSGDALIRLGMTGRIFLLAGQWWTLCTACFLHGSILHILFNMVIMRRYLPMVADLYGNVRAFVIYMVAGIAGFLLSAILGLHGSVGASGAIFGLLGALICYGRRTGQSYVTNQLWTMAIVMFVMGFIGMGGAHVDVWAHAGGFAGGFLAAQMMPTTHRGEGPGLMVLAGSLTLVTLAGFVLSFIGFAPVLLR
jgi:rhomboid protease GluP